MTAIQAEMLKIEREFEKREEKGTEEGLRTGVKAICELLDIELTPARQRALGAMDAAGLRSLLDQIKQQRRWPAARRSRSG